MGRTGFTSSLVVGLLILHGPNPLGSSAAAQGPEDTALLAPWQHADVKRTNEILLPGIATSQDGAFLVEGAGFGFLGFDTLHYVYRPGPDGELIARVSSFDDAAGTAVAGLTWRESLDPFAAQISIVLQSDGTIRMFSRSSTGSTFTDLSKVVPGTAPRWLKITREADWFNTYHAQDGSAWTFLGSIRVPMTSAIVGMTVASGEQLRRSTAIFDQVAFNAGPPSTAGSGSALPLPWRHRDIGTVGLAGSAALSGETFTVVGAGSDIWGTADSFHYVSQAITGDAQIVARLLGESGTHSFAKAGLMVRTSLEPDAAHVVLSATPNGEIEFMSRAVSGGATAYLGGGALGFPGWLRLCRVGGTITASVSADGVTWSVIGSAPLSGPSAEFGLAVTSHEAASRNTATFDRVAIGEADSASARDVVIYASDLPATALHGAWTTASDATAAHGVTVRTADAAVASISGPLESPTDYVDVSFDAQAGVPYTLWLRLRSLNDSKYNDSVWVQFSDAVANGAPAYLLGTGSGLLVNLATDVTGLSLKDWGWQNSAYWLSQPTAVTFPSGGAHTLRIQVREDGVSLDQIVLSPSRFVDSAPGSVTSDSTVVPR